MTSAQAVVWEGIGEWRAEIAHVGLASPVSARGTQIGVAYRADYELEAPECVTRSLVVEAAGEGWVRRLELGRDGAGAWTVNDEPRPDLGGALDCDLALSPLTNLMPILRHGLHRTPGELDFLMAWVSVPDLEVHASRQRYETVRTGEGPVVRYSDDEFSAELELDADGLVLVYPGLARRVALRA